MVLITGEALIDLGTSHVRKTIGRHGVDRLATLKEPEQCRVPRPSCPLFVRCPHGSRACGRFSDTIQRSNSLSDVTASVVECQSVPNGRLDFIELKCPHASLSAIALQFRGRLSGHLRKYEFHGSGASSPHYRRSMHHRFGILFRAGMPYDSDPWSGTESLVGSVGGDLGRGLRDDRGDVVRRRAREAIRALSWTAGKTLFVSIAKR